MKGLAGTFVIVMFILAAGAGAVFGKLIWTSQPKGPASNASLSETLHLSAEQNKKMQDIWAPMQSRSLDYVAQAHQIQVEEDKEILAMCSDEQKLKFQQIRERSKQRLNDLEKDRIDAFRRAVAETKAILDKKQNDTYEAIIQNRFAALPGSDAGHSELK